MHQRFGIGKIIFLIFPALFFSFPVFAERLSFKNYSTSDGLANDNVNRIVADSRGFMWFCTGEGLSRFDGFQFKNYTQDQGLPHRNVNDFLETKDGTYLIATTNGLAVFNPLGKPFRWNLIEGKLEQTSGDAPMFTTYHTPDAQNSRDLSKNISTLTEDKAGKIYAGTSHGLYRVLKTTEDWNFEKIEFDEWRARNNNFNFVFADSKNNIWLATNLAIYLLRENGEIVKASDSGGNTVFETKDGKIWIDSGGNDSGIRVFALENSVPVLVAAYTKKDGLPNGTFTNVIAESSDGRILISSDGKLCEFLPNAAEREPKFRVYENEFGTAAADKSGNIWFGQTGKGVARFSLNSFTVFDERDGIPKEAITSIFGNRRGEVFLTAGKTEIVRIHGGKIESVTPSGFTVRNWINTFPGFQTTDGELWMSSSDGLFRYPQTAGFNVLARTPPKKIYTTADGLFSNQVFATFEDSRGDVWLSASGGTDSVLRWERATEKIYRYTSEDGLPENSGAISFGEDAAGNVWIGFFFGQLVRYKDGRFRSFTDEGLLPVGAINQMLSDKSGRFWLAAASRGLFRVDNPDDEKPSFSNFSTADGFSSNEAICLTDDVFGRLYIGTGRGINRFEPESGQTKIYTQADGLPANTISQCFRDSNNNLWFSANNSLIKFVPTSDEAAQNPPILIDGISVNGSARKISELGENRIENLEFDSNERQLHLSFFAISFDPGENLRYQYKLNENDWSEPDQQRSVNLNLAAGSYNFAVRAVNSEGVVSEKPATISFQILPPLYQRWWFITLAGILIAALIFGLDRYRVSKTRQVEKALDETRRAGKIIRESETRYRTLAETASDAIITIDAESRIVYANDAAEEIFGYEIKEMLGKPLMFLMPERHRQFHENGLNRYLSSKTKTFEWSAVELEGLHKSGGEIPLELSFGEFEKDGERFFTGIARDISERKKAEAALQKSREERIAELQRVRSRIATDLHDDIGSSLTQITLFSEIARQRQRESGEVGEPLDTISNVANELVETMSDIVWAINPKKDHLQDLTQRMRRFAANVLTAKDIEMRFIAPGSETELPLGANIRREVFLIFKETVNNIVKHSEATRAELVFSVENHFLTITFKDNGKGFDRKREADGETSGNPDWKKFRGGNGLLNMKKRAEELGGTYEIESEPGKGTGVMLKIPLQKEDKKDKG